MKRYSMITLLFVMTVLYSLPAFAKNTRTIDGSMQGYSCVLHGHICPIDSLDPHLALEPDFVLFLEKGDYYLLPNIARIVKAKYVHKSIRVIGDLHPQYKTIDVNKLMVKKGNDYKTVWSQEKMMEELKKKHDQWYEDAGG